MFVVSCYLYELQDSLLFFSPLLLLFGGLSDFYLHTKYYFVDFFLSLLQNASLVQSSQLYKDC